MDSQVVDFDEKSMIREQDRITRENRRKKNKKKKIIIFSICFLILIFVVWFFIWGKELQNNQILDDVTIQVNANQEVNFAKITNIKGNEITYAFASVYDGKEIESNSEVPDKVSMQNVDFEKSDRGSMPEGNVEMPDRGSMPEGDVEIPNRENMSEDMSNRKQGMGGNKQGNSMPENTISLEQFTYDDITYQVGNDVITTYIPVGTDVITKLGTTTTFSRLAVGDYIAIVSQVLDGEEVMMLIYIVG